MQRFLVWFFAGLTVLFSIPMTSKQALAIPAFARKYDVPCSLCHSAFPKLNDFGVFFKDNGFQMGGDKDNPVNQPAAYWPLAMRTPVGYLYTTTNNQNLDKNGILRPRTERAGSMQDLGIDLLSFGTLAPDVTYHIVLTVPGEVGLESAWVRLDKLAGTPLLNFKVGIFEPDIPFPTKRILTLTTDYPIYNYHPGGKFGNGENKSRVEMGLGENQSGVELMGHEDTLGIRYSVAVLEGDNTDLSKKEPLSPDLFESLTYRVAGQRVGLFAYEGSEATKFLTDSGVPIDGTGYAERRFSRLGADAKLHAGPVDFLILGMVGMDPKQAIDTVQDDPSDPTTLGIQAAPRDGKYNGGFVEVNYHVSPILVLIGRYDRVKNTRQPDPTVAKRSEGDIEQMVFAFRYYLNISNRTDLALHGEYSQMRTTVAPGLDNVVKSTLLAFDFAF
jgi:hypothetical protein